MASTFFLENIFLKVLLKHLILIPKAGMFADAFLKTLLRSLIVDSS